MRSLRKHLGGRGGGGGGKLGMPAEHLRGGAGIAGRRGEGNGDHAASLLELLLLQLLVDFRRRPPVAAPTPRRPRQFPPGKSRVRDPKKITALILRSFLLHNDLLDRRNVPAEAGTLSGSGSRAAWQLARMVLTRKVEAGFDMASEVIRGVGRLLDSMSHCTCCAPPCLPRHAAALALCIPRVGTGTHAAWNPAEQRGCLGA